MLDLSPVPQLAVQIFILWLFARILGSSAQKLGMPAMAGEIAAGLLLGPTILGHLAPSFFTSLFNTGEAAVHLRQDLVKGALLAFLFYAGLETGLFSLKNTTRSVLVISALGMAVPFAAGVLMVWMAPAWWSGFSAMPVFKIAIFLGAALSISALPVIARIFMDLKMMQTRNAALVMTAATLNDFAGWVILSWILCSERTENFFYELLPLGAFWIGMTCSGFLKQHVSLMRLFSTATLGFFAPVYFSSLGLRIDFMNHVDFSLTAVVFLLACLAKTGGVYAGGLLSGLTRQDSFLIATAMNARGAMEILLATLAFEAGLINNSFFIALVFMAVFTTLVSVVVLRRTLTFSQATCN